MPQLNAENITENFLSINEINNETCLFWNFILLVIYLLLNEPTINDTENTDKQSH